MTELGAIERDTPAWTTDADGRHVMRAELVDALVEDVTALYDPFAGLVEALKTGNRKTISIKRVLELIEEHRP